MAVVVELLDRANRHLSFFRFHGGRVVVGRAPDCEVMLADPHVDPHHLEITEMPVTGALSARDLSSLNGSFRGAAWRRRRPLGVVDEPLSSGEILTVGRTRLRVMSSSAPVAKALEVSRWETIGAAASQPWLWGLLAILAVILSALQSYFTAPVGSGVAVHWLNGFYPLLAALIYAAFWSFVARSTGSEPKLALNFALALAALVVLGSFQLGNPFVLYNLDIWYFGRYLEPLVNALVLFAVIFMSLATATHLPRWARLGVAMMGPVAIAVQLVSSMVQRAEFDPVPEYNRALVAPSWQLRKAVPVEQFLEEAAVLDQQLAPRGAEADGK